MKYSNSKLISILTCLLLLGLLWASCGENGQAKNVDETEENALLTPVEVSKVTQDEISAYLTGTATLEAENEAEVVAKISEIVEEIRVEEGMFVKKGQILARLDADMLRIDLQQTQADLNKLQNDFDRNQELFKKRLISKEEFQNVRFQFEAQKAALEKARLNLNYATIHAPISGVIAKRHIKPGNMVNQNQPLFRIVDFNHLIANLFVPEVDIQKVQIGQKALLKFDATNGSSFEGYVERINPVVDPASGTVKVTIAVNKARSHIKPGMFARVQIVYDTHPNSLLIPKQALLSEDGTELVYTIQDSIAIKKFVKTGYRSESMIEIVEGLTAGEQVVVIGQNGLKDSSKVEIVQ